MVVQQPELILLNKVLLLTLLLLEQIVLQAAIVTMAAMVVFQLLRQADPALIPIYGIMVLENGTLALMTGMIIRAIGAVATRNGGMAMRVVLLIKTFAVEPIV